MTLFESLKLFVLANGPLAAKLPGGVFPQYIPQNPVLPLLVIRLISGTSAPATHDNGASQWSSSRIEFTIYGADFKTQEQAIMLLDSLFSPFHGYLGGSTNGYFSTTRIYGPRSIQDPSTRLVGIQIDIIGMLKRDTLS